MTPAAKRWTVWAVLAVATGYAAIQVSGDGVRRAAHPRAGSSSMEVPASLRDPASPGIDRMLTELGRPRLSDGVVGHPFASGSWEPPATGKPKEEAGPPPFGYAYGGRFKDAAGERVYLLRGNDLIPVKRGDRLDGGYEVVGIEGDRLELMWIPGKRKVTLSLSSLVIPAAAGPGTASAAGVGPVISALERSSSAPLENRAVGSGGGPTAATGAAPIGAMAIGGAGQAIGSSGAVASNGAALGVAPTRSGVLGTPPASVAPIGTPPRGTGMTMLPSPTTPMPILPAPTGKLGQ